MTIRDQAIRILAVCASSDGSCTSWKAARVLGCSSGALELAHLALDCAQFDVQCREPWRAFYAEAECMLREGWCPRG